MDILFSPYFDVLLFILYFEEMFVLFCFLLFSILLGLLNEGFMVAV